MRDVWKTGAFFHILAHTGGWKVRIAVKQLGNGLGDAAWRLLVGEETAFWIFAGAFLLKTQ